MNASKKDVVFTQNLVMLGCGFSGQGVLPLLFKHIDIKPEQVLILTADNRGHELAKFYHVPFHIKPVTQENYITILDSVLKSGDFLLNLATDVDNSFLIDYCAEKGILYLDTGMGSSLSKSMDSSVSFSQRSLAELREHVLQQKKKWGRKGPTAVMAHGANPGIVSHLVKRALLNIAHDEGRKIEVPNTREEWAKLSESLGIKTIHIAERDTQISKHHKKKGEFINTWSIDGLICEVLRPAELGWGTHEKYFPASGMRHEFGDKSAIYLNRPGASVHMRTWLPLAGPQIGFLIPHNEALSLSSYLSIGSGEKAEYRPTVHYVYHPCDDAVLSLIELQERNWAIQELQRPMDFSEIVSGIDELGVLLMGHKKGAYWFGSRLDIHEAQKMIPNNSATSLQVTSGVISGMIWAMRHPDNGIVEAEEMDFEEVLAIAGPYWGTLVGEYSHWTPLEKRNILFPEDIDTNDPWQFKNFLVV